MLRRCMPHVYGAAPYPLVVVRLLGSLWIPNQKKKKKVSEEIREFNSAWTDLFAFTANAAGLLECLIAARNYQSTKK